MTKYSCFLKVYIQVEKKDKVTYDKVKSIKIDTNLLNNYRKQEVHPKLLKSGKAT